MLLGGLDALGHDRHAEQVGELDDREDDGVARAILFQVGDEALVDLDDVDREALEVGERGVAGSEVVEGERHAELLQLVEDDERPFGVLHEDALGHLEGDQLGIGLGAGEHRGDGRP